MKRPAAAVRHNALLFEHAARELSLNQLKKFDEWIQEQIRRAEESQLGEKLSGVQVEEKHSVDHKTYRLVGVRCGKEKCKCANPGLHGPYWYAYWSDNGTTKSQYIGKSLPKNKGPHK